MPREAFALFALTVALAPLAAAAPGGIGPIAAGRVEQDYHFCPSGYTTAIVNCPSSDWTAASAGGMSNGALELSDGADVCVDSSGNIKSLLCPQVSGLRLTQQIRLNQPDQCVYSTPAQQPVCATTGYAFIDVPDATPQYLGAPGVPLSAMLAGTNAATVQAYFSLAVTCAAYALPVFLPTPSVPPPPGGKLIGRPSKAAMPDAERAAALKKFNSK
jgi:hypothetical protein